MITPKSVEEVAYIKVTLDYAPEENGKEFDEWCEKYGFRPLGSGRRAWCSSLGTYMREASGVAVTDSGDIFLFYKDDILTHDQAAKEECERRVREAISKATYEDLAKEWLARYEGIEHMHVKPEAMYTINTILRRCFNQALTPEPTNNNNQL